jgi:1-acyl-sn-glycerol-3-phosphate acyltransferase
MRTAGIALIAVALAALAAVLLAWIRRGPRDTPGVAILRLINDVYTILWHRVRWEPGPPASPIPIDGPVIVVANHQSAVDPMVLAAATRRLVRFLMAREYYQTFGLEWLFRTAGEIPVNRDGSDLGATKTALKVLRDGGVIGIFPQGGIRESGFEEEADGKAGVALLALRTGAQVVPAFISGTPIRESVFLTMLIPSRSRIRFGEPLRFAPAGKKITREQIDQATRKILEAIAILRPRLSS